MMQVLLQMFRYETKTKLQHPVRSYEVWTFSLAYIGKGIKI